MTPIRCYVIDDEPLAVRLLSSYVERTPSLELAGTFNVASDAVRGIIDGDVDLVFLDIEMPQINGIEFAKIIPSTCRIVFITAYDRYAVQGFKVNAVDYLLKPVSYDEFLDAVQRVMRSMGAQGVSAETAAKTAVHDDTQREFILVKSEYKLIQIRVADILLIEGLKDYIKIFIQEQTKAVLTLMSMKSIEQALPAGMFMRVHRSYIVNTSKISVIERNRIVIADHVVPVSDTYRQQFTEYISKLNPEE